MVKKGRRDMTSLSVKTKVVTLKDGTTAVINTSDFDPAIHTEVSKRPPVGKKRKREAGVMRSGGRSS